MESDLVLFVREKLALERLSRISSYGPQSVLSLQPDFDLRPEFSCENPQNRNYCDSQKNFASNAIALIDTGISPIVQSDEELSVIRPFSPKWLFNIEERKSSPEDNNYQSSHFFHGALMLKTIISEGDNDESIALLNTGLQNQLRHSVYPIRIFNGKDVPFGSTGNLLARVLKPLIEHGLPIVNFSGSLSFSMQGGPYGMPVVAQELHQTIQESEDSTIFVLAAGNDNKLLLSGFGLPSMKLSTMNSPYLVTLPSDFTHVLPQGFVGDDNRRPKNILNVGVFSNNDGFAKQSPASNYGPLIDVAVLDVSSTSLAAAKVSKALWSI